MAQSKRHTRAHVAAGDLLRPHYEAGTYLSAEDLRSEQEYRRQRQRRHNRFLHGSGRVCGLRVVPARDASRPWGVLVCPGYALTCCGDEIELSAAATLDIRDYLWSRPQVGGAPVRTAYIGIRYAEEPSSPAAMKRAACQCDDVMQPSRLGDSFRLDVLWDAPATHSEPVDLCANQLASCPKCAGEPYVILASIDLPNSEGQGITLERIHNLP